MQRHREQRKCGKGNRWSEAGAQVCPKSSSPGPPGWFEDV